MEFIWYIIYVKTIIAGGRKGTTRKNVFDAANQCGWDITEVVSGAAKGADTFGEEWAKENSIKIKRFKPDWKDLSHPNAVVKEGPYGKYDATAGIRRNKEMGDYAEALVAIWDGKSTGTKNMIEYAKSKNLKVFVYLIK